MQKMLQRDMWYASDTTQIVAIDPGGFQMGYSPHASLQTDGTRDSASIAPDPGRPEVEKGFPWVSIIRLLSHRPH